MTNGFMALPRPRLRVLSLGAGVQSKTMLLMALHGEFEVMPDVVAFADTQDEPSWVYDEVAQLRERCDAAGLPFYTVSAGKLSTAILRDRFNPIPTYSDRGSGTGSRQCTRHFKIEPLRLQQRALVGAKPRMRLPTGTVEVWVGISLDEVSRLKPSRLRWQHNRWPLIEKGMRRRDCVLWLEAHGYTVPKKSACIFCPYHDDAYWRDLKLNHPHEWAYAVAIDRQLNQRGEYLHRSRRPLESIDFSNLADLGQLNFFENECDGVCGV